MAVQIELFVDPARRLSIDEIELGEVFLSVDENLSQGVPVHVFGRNSGNSTVRDFAVSAEGEGAEVVQLAVERNGEPGVWAAPGESIHVVEYLGSGDEFSFWVRGLFSQEDSEKEYEFEIIFQGVAIG